MLMVGEEPSVVTETWEEVVVCWPVAESLVSTIFEVLPEVEGEMTVPVFVWLDEGVDAELELGDDVLVVDDGLVGVWELEEVSVGVVGLLLTW